MHSVLLGCVSCQGQRKNIWNNFETFFFKYIKSRVCLLLPDSTWPHSFCGFKSSSCCCCQITAHCRFGIVSRTLKWFNTHSLSHWERKTSKKAVVENWSRLQNGTTGIVGRSGCYLQWSTTGVRLLISDLTLPSLLWTIKKWNRCGKSVRIRHRQTLVISGEISFFQINPIVQLPDICQDSEVQIFSRGGYSQQMDIQSNHWLLSKVGTADLGRPDPGLNSDGTYSSFEREKKESVLFLPKWLLGFLIVKMYL